MSKKILLLLAFLLPIFADEGLKLSTLGDGGRIISSEMIALSPKWIESLDSIDKESLHWQKSPNGIFGRVDDTAIISFDILNDTDKEQQIVVMHTRPSIDKILFWVLRDGRLIETFYGGDRVAQEKRAIYAINSTFPLSLQAGEKLEIISQIRTTGVLDVNYEVLPKSVFEKNSKLQISWLGIFVGTMLMLIFYNAIHYIGTKQKSYLLHALYAFFVSYVHLGVYGFIYFSGVSSAYKTIDILTYISVGLAVMFHLLYPVVLFDLKKQNPRLALLLQGIALLFFGVALFFILAFFDESLLFAMAYITIPLMVVLLLFLLLALYFVYKKLVGAKLFFLGQLSAFLGATYSTLAVNTDLVGLSLQAAVFSSLLAMFEVIFVTLAITQRINRELKEKELLANITKLYERYIYVGSYTSNVIHQWKAPLNQLGGLIALMQAYDEKGIEVGKVEYKRHLQELQQINDNLKKISADIHGCLSSSLEMEIVVLKDVIEQTLKYLGRDIEDVSVEILGCDKKIVLNRAALIQILLVLLSNSVKIFQLRKISNPKVAFRFETDEQNRAKLLLSDNGGGIVPKVLPKLFSPYTSGTNSLGSGLFLAKKLAQEKLGGNLLLHHSDKTGATFMIEFGIFDRQ